MKFILVLHLCSFLPGATNCLTSQYVGEFKDYYSCARAGYQRAYQSLSVLDINTINKDRLAVKIECKEMKII